MRTLFDGEHPVSYSQFHLGTGTPPVEGWVMDDCFAGQCNGLCGAAERGQLMLITGLHTGRVPVTVELHDTAPPVPELPEVVEVAFPVIRGPVGLYSDFIDDQADLALAPDFYRVRYCAAGMDQARAMDCRVDDDPALDRYLLQFWPAPIEPDRVIRTTSEIATYWHSHAAALPAPTRTSSERARAVANDPKYARKRLIYRNLLWAGQQPDGPLGTVELARTLVLLDRALADDLVVLPASTQRDLALWTARRAITDTRLDQVPWISDALSHLGHTDLPGVLADESTALHALGATPDVPRTVVTSPDEHGVPLLAQAAALPALSAAMNPDPTVALLDTVHHALHAAGAENHRALLDDLRAAARMNER
ncbi:hypothetical protein DMP17_44535 [Pseudonocardia sp. TMWB2A]|uniref:hypothetical protein n=1 Tax=Pseudonocardia sp. TMWB2A TaxID=687430 RepID=UPI00307E9604